MATTQVGDPQNSKVGSLSIPGEMDNGTPCRTDKKEGRKAKERRIAEENEQRKSVLLEQLKTHKRSPVVMMPPMPRRGRGCDNDKVAPATGPTVTQNPTKTKGQAKNDGEAQPRNPRRSSTDEDCDLTTEETPEKGAREETPESDSSESENESRSESEHGGREEGEREGTEGEESVGTEDAEGDPYEEAEEGMETMAAWCTQQAKGVKVTSLMADRLKSIIREVRRNVGKLQAERMYWKGKCDGRAEVLALVKEARRDVSGREGGEERQTYVEVARAKDDEREGRTGGDWTTVKGRKAKKAKPKVVLVRQEGKKSEEVRETMRAAVDPCLEDVRVRRMTMVKNGLAVEVDGQEAAERLMANEEAKEAGLVMMMPKKRRPLVMIYDVETHRDDAELREEVYDRNFKEDMSRGEFEEGFAVKHRIRRGVKRD